MINIIYKIIRRFLLIMSFFIDKIKTYILLKCNNADFYSVKYKHWVGQEVCSDFSIRCSGHI